MRQFVSDSNPDKEGLITVSGKDYRYFKQVLRLVPGDMLAVRIPSGELVDTTVAKIDESKKNVVLQLCDSQSSDKTRTGGKNQSSFLNEVEFYLFQFAAKGPKMDLIVRQAAECGVTKIIPVLGEFTQAGSAEKNFRSDRYERIIKEARQQSGSPVATSIEKTVDVDGAIKLWKDISEGKDNCFCCVLYERSEKTKGLHEALSEYKDVKKCAIICGAEGGISPGEIEKFAGEGIVPVHFDTNILRCETAALYGMACVQSAVSEKSVWQQR